MQNWEKIWAETDVHVTMHELLERTRQCEGIALDVCGQIMSYAEFHERSDAMAAWLQARGYGPDDSGKGSTIILSMGAKADLFCMLAASLKAGAIVTVTEENVTEARLKKLYEQTNARARIMGDQIEAIYAEGKRLPLQKITNRFRPEDVYAIWYTSGSTGEPCCIQTISYNTVCNIAPVAGNEIMSTCLKESSALLSISHPSFGVGFTNFFYALFYGKKFVYVQPGLENTIREIGKKITENRECFLLFTPSAVTACLEDEAVRKSFVNCSAVMMGADVVRSSLISEVQKALGPKGKVVNLYGISDVGLVAAKIAREDDPLHAIGKATACTQVFTVDEDRNPLPEGETGEFCFSGLRVGPGYLGAAPGKMNKFVHREDGTALFYSGDYGYVDAQGEIYLLGRTDRRIKHLGYRIDGVEVEETIRSRAHVRAAAVKLFDTGDKNVFCAFYENDEELDPDYIRSCIAQVLPRYCIPARFIHMKALPLTERGKLDYKALTLPEQDIPDKAYEAPLTEKERILCEAYEKILKTGRPVGRNESFLELGGDSVSGMLLLAELVEKYGLHYTMEDLMTCLKPEKLALIPGDAKEEEHVSKTPDTVTALPDELQKLKEEIQAEEIFPAETASGMYLFLQESGSAYQRGLIFSLRVRLRRSFTEKGFRERIRCVVNRHPSLRSGFIKDASGKRWQVFRREKEVPVYYRDLSGMSEEAGERFLSGFFQVMDENGEPFQVGCFPKRDGSSELLIRLTHTLVDGTSAVILINEIAQETDPVGNDGFYEYRRRKLIRREIFPKELSDYYSGYFNMKSIRLPILFSGAVDDYTERREILIDPQRTRKLQKECAESGLSLAGYVEYCYGRGLLAAINRESIWFSHLYSGRDTDAGAEAGIVGNLFYTMPVFLSSDMSERDFQREMMKPWKHPYVTDTAEYRALNTSKTEHGIVSRILLPYHENVISRSNGPENMDTGHYMEIKDGSLRIVLRYPGDKLQSKAYETVEAVMRSRLLE